MRWPCAQGSCRGLRRNVFTGLAWQLAPCLGLPQTEMDSTRAKQIGCAAGAGPGWLSELQVNETASWAGNPPSLVVLQDAE